MSTPTSTCRTFHLILFLLLRLTVSVRARSQDDYLPSSSPNTRLLSQVLSYMNQSVAACNDYYAYACGKWGVHHANDSFMEITGLIDQKVNENLVTLLDEQMQRGPLDPASVEAKLVSFYRSCRQISQTRRSGKRYLLLVPPNEQIPWPQFKRRSEFWGSSKFQWLETLARLRRYGLNNVLFKLDALPENSSNYIIAIKLPNFEQKNERSSSWLLTKLQLRLLGVSSGKASILARQVLRLKTAVRNLVDRFAEDSGGELNLQQLERQVGGQWRKYFEILLGHSIVSNYELQVENMAYLAALVQLINAWDREVLASYFMLRLASYLQENTMDSDEPVQCVQDVRRYMELGVNLLYEQRFIGSAKLQQHQTDVQELFEQLRQQFLNKLDENYPSLAASDLAMLRSKLLNMTINIGNMPQRADRSSFVQRFYADLQLVENDDYVVNHLRVLEFQTRRWLDQLNKPFNTTDYFFISDPDSGISSTPYYMLRQNVIIVPYGILQEPIFHHDAHDIFKISLLGFTLAHELMHGFGSGGLIYDYKGNYNERGAQIILDSKYTSALSCLNGDETDYLDEREADFAGIQLAYDVYFARDSKLNQTQPDFTSVPLKQLFFLNLAQFFCGNATLIQFEGHDNDEMRLKQMLINFPAFAEAHGCRQNHDNMHPAQKCRLW